MQRVIIDEDSRQNIKPLDSVYKVQLDPENNYSLLLAALLSDNSFTY